MRESVVCNVCENPGSFDRASDVATVKSNVRKFADESFTVWRCSNCMSLHSKEAVELDAYYVDYPMTKQSADFSTRLAMRNRLRFMVRHGLTAEHAILDYGCGKGLFVDFLNERGFHAVGYDPYVARFSDRCVLGEAFDYVTSQDVIEHVDAPRELIGEYARLLNSGGVLFVGTPNAAEITLDRLDVFSMELHQPYHRHLLSEQALRQLCERAGLRVVDVDHRFYYDTLFPMTNAQFIRRYIRKSGGLLDAGFEEPKVAMVLTSAELLFFGLAGYFFRAAGNMVAAIRRTS